MILTIKQKLYRTKRTKHLDKLIGVAAEIYNHCIALHKKYYKVFGRYIDKMRMQAHIAKLKKIHPRWKTLDAQAIQNIVERIDFGYQKFFKKDNNRTPMFRNRRKYKSLTYKQTGWKVSGNQLTIQRMLYKFYKSRELLGAIKQVIVKRDYVGDWYVCFICEVQGETKKRVKTGKTAGLDFGLKTFLTSSENGKKYQSPLFYKQGSDNLKRLSKKLSPKQKGSNNRRKARLDLAHVHRKVANQRLDHHFKLARELALAYDAIFVENLNMKGMKRLWGKKVSDLGFAQFVSILKWMGQKLGSELVVIDRFYPSSKTCSSCEYVHEELTITDRQWTCPQCSTEHNRDVNAAINIKRVGTSTLAGDKVRPVSAGVCC